MAAAAEEQRAATAEGERSPQLAEGSDAEQPSIASGASDAVEEVALRDEPNQRIGDDSGGNATCIVGADRPTHPAASEENTLGASGSASGDPAPPPQASPAMTMKGKILQLKEEQRKLRTENKAKSCEIRNTERCSKRLKTKVVGLTDDDLNEVLRARTEAKAAAAKAGAKPATAKAKSSAAGSKRSNPAA